ncbi:MAG: hypothetical protein DDT24_00417 [Chloroflexi bacterium]|nr:hypothetical protein [Chloroflexota bacterium]
MPAQVRKHLNIGPGQMPAGQSGHVRSLLGADLQQDCPPGVQFVPRLSQKPAYLPQPIGAAGERPRRLEEADLIAQPLHLPIADVRKIRQYEVEPGDRLEKVALQQVNSACYLVPFAIQCGDFQSCGGYVNGINLSLGQMHRQGNGDGTTARAHISDGWGGVAARQLQRLFHQELGLGTRYERVSVDPKFQSEEFLVPGDVGDGLMAQTAPDQPV